MLALLAAAGAVLALPPAVLFFRNLRLYVPPPVPGLGRAEVSVLIPARDEEASIRGAIEAALGSQGVVLEVIVLDDHSSDRTAAIVRELSARDGRVRLESAPPLPEGWCGKQHACHILASLARSPLLAFLDADVRVEADGLARSAAFLEASGADLVSGVPRQVTISILEQLVIPIVHFVLLAFLPLARMRRSTLPAYGAGCGQLFMARRSAYLRAGGHAAIRRSLHDGVTLPRVFRRAGLRTDLFDATPAASCRMYRSAAGVWRGLAKNATEGLASAKLILPATLVLVGGQVLPPLVLAAALWELAVRDGSPGPELISALAISAATTALGLAPRFAAVRRFRQPYLSAAFHPLGIIVLVLVQWYAFLRALVGLPSGWKGRTYSAGVMAATTDPRVIE